MRSLDTLLQGLPQAHYQPGLSQNQLWYQVPWLRYGVNEIFLISQWSVGTNGAENGAHRICLSVGNSSICSDWIKAGEFTLYRLHNAHERLVSKLR